MIEWINKGERTTAIDIIKAEQHYNAQYVADLCLKMPSGMWSEASFPIFWVETPARPEYSNYFSLSIRDTSVMIGNGISAVQGIIFRAVCADDGEIIFSRFRHDFRKSEDGTVTADGGRDYFRGYGAPRWLKVVGPEFFVCGPDDLEMEAT